MLQRQVNAPRLSWADRAVLSALAGCSRAASSVGCDLSSRILLRWHADLVRRHWAYPRRAPGRPRTAPSVRSLVLKMARENPARASIESRLWW